MKRIAILIVWLLLSGVSICAYGQVLLKHKCANGKWGFKDVTGSVLIPCKYDYIADFNEGIAKVQIGKKWGYIDKSDREVIPIKYNFSEIKNNRYKALLAKYERERALALERELAAALKRERDEQLLRSSFSVFAQNYFEQWLQKGEFERTVDWELRISEDNRKAKEAEVIKEAEQAFIAEISKYFRVGSMTLGAYDADKEVFLISNSVHGDWLQPVPIDEAPKFRNNWNNLVKTPQYVIRDDRIAFAGYKFEPVAAAVANNNTTEQSDWTIQINSDDARTTQRNTRTASQGVDSYNFRFYIGTGVGHSYGTLGTSLEARFNRFGVHAGIGWMPLLNSPAWSLGTKWYFWKHLYFDTMVGVVGKRYEFRYNNGNYTENNYAILGITPMVGVNWSWGGNVRFGVNAGAGYYTGFNSDLKGFVYDAGINISFGKRK